LVLVGAAVPTTVFTDIANAAHTAGFVHVQVGAQQPTVPAGSGR